MSRYVNIDQIIAEIEAKWGCDPAYYIGSADVHEAQLDAALIKFLQSRPSINIVRCGECARCKEMPSEANIDWHGLKFCSRTSSTTYDDWFCAIGIDKKEEVNEN